VAYHLARRGVRDVVVVEREPEIGHGSTPKATGGFRAQFDSEVNVRLSLLSRALFASEREIDFGYEPHGYLFLARSADELERLRLAQNVQHACGLGEARMVSPSEARTLNPLIEDERVVGGTFCPTDGFLRPMNMLRGYVEAARELGVRFSFNPEVHRHADVVVNCAGAWAGSPVTPLRRNVAATCATNVAPASMPMTIWSGDWFHFRERDGRVLLLWPDDPPDDEAWLPALQRFTRERVPRLASLPIEERWSGLYEMSPDEHALLGHSHDNVFVAIGSSGHGVMHAPALGHLLAELVVDGRTSIDISALNPRRFESRVR